ncbi:MAG: hypothetical protein ABJB47_14195, partial [Actinomycetota bacterium]
PAVAFEGPAAQILADNAAIIGDLQFVMECCKRLLTELATPEDERDPVVPQALWSSALVAYARCFGKGKRLGLTPEDVSGLPLEGEVMKYHKWLLEERNRNVTHSANPFDVVKIGAVLSPKENFNRKLKGIAILPISHVLVDETGVRQLGGLASELAKQAAAKAQEQQDAVLADASQLSIDSLDKLPLLQMLTAADTEGDPA